MRHPEKIIRAKYLRKNMPEAEIILWSKIQKNKLGYQFRRQYPIGPYFADFACLAQRLVVKLDGSQHITNEAVDYDNRRTEFIKSQNWTLIRIPNADIKKNLDEVLHSLELALSGQEKASELFLEKYDLEPNKNWIPPPVPPPKSC
jgi:very-short-patch-repair endonuclease